MNNKVHERTGGEERGDEAPHASGLCPAFGAQTEAKGARECPTEKVHERTGSDTPLLSIHNLTRTYRHFSLHQACFELQAGSMMGLLGPNGAGKSTLIKAIMGLVRQDGGTLRLRGELLTPSNGEARRRIAYVPDEPKFAPGARLQTLQEVYAAFYPDFNLKAWHGLMSDFGLRPEQKAKTLSLGQRTRFALALALSRNWELLLLDEPTTGLDPVFRRELIQRFSNELSEHRAILFSTHITSDLDRCADDVTFLRDGRVVISDTQECIKTQWGLVKGGLELLDEKVRQAFVGLRENAFGFEGLTRNIKGAREHFGSNALIETPTLEDILVLLGRKEMAHA